MEQKYSVQRLLNKININIIYFAFTVIICLMQSNYCISQNWQKLFSGTNYEVECLFTDTTNNLLYVGGTFTNAGGFQTVGIAIWDGNNWSILNTGQIPFPVKTITKYNNKIYVGGGSYEKIIRFTGSIWESVDGGMPNGVVLKLKVYNGELYAFGNFDSVAQIPAKCMAKYNGINWSSIAPQFTSPTENISISNAIFYQGELIISGNFSSTNGLNEIARWDGNLWHSLNEGVLGDAIVDALAIYHNELYVGGIFTKTDGNQGNYIMKWNGQHWSEVGSGVIGTNGNNGQIHDMLVFKNELYVVGVFNYAGGVPMQYISKWDGNKWCGLGGVFNDRIISIASFDSTIYVGGGFFTINGDTVNHIAKWTGGSYIDTCSQTFGVQENFSESNVIGIFPNPVTNYFTITTDGHINQPKTVNIYSIEGVLVKKERFTSNEISIETGEFSSGIFIVELMTNEGSYYNKIVVTK